MWDHTRPATCTWHIILTWKKTLLGHWLAAEYGNESPKREVKSARADTNIRKVAGSLRLPIRYTVLTWRQEKSSLLLL